MGKKEKVRRMKAAGLHEIKNKYRARAVRKKRKGLVLSAKKKRRTLKACASASAIFLGLLGLFAIGNSFFQEPAPPINVGEDFVTVSYELPTNGSPDDYAGKGVSGALRNIGHMNYQFKQQNKWYSETHGTTSTAAGPQSVNTIKQYSDSVLIMVDIARSSIIKAGRQFCYIGNEVMWRNVADGSNYRMDNYEDMLALKWKNELVSHTTIDAFKKRNGLPGTEFSVYVINEQTLYYASDVELVKSRNASPDWSDDYIQGNVYRQTYYLRAGNAKRLGAAAHYSNQVVFTGSLQGVTFKPLSSSLVPKEAYEGKDLVGEAKKQDEALIKVTYTFDSQWQVLHADIDEAYEAQKGVIKTTCTSKFATDFEYGTKRAESPDYEGFFKDHVGEGVEDDLQKPLDSLSCIMDAFLSGPVTYELALDLNGKKTNGLIALDAEKLGPALDGGGEVDAGTILGGLGIKAQIGDIYLYLEDSTAYLAVGDLKVKLSVNDLLTLIQGNPKAEPATKEAPAPEESESEGTDKEDSVFTLKDPVLNADETQAIVLAVLDLSSLGVELEIPLNFTFNLDENKKASLEICEVSVNYQGIEANITIKDTNKTLSELTNKEAFVELYGYAEAVYNLVMGKKLNIALDYADGKMALTGNIGIDFTGELLVAGQLSLNMGEKSKTVGIIVKEGTAYLNLEGIKLSVPIDETIELVQSFLTKDEGAKSNSTEIAGILNKVLSAVFDNDLAALLSVSETDNALAIGVKGTELLKAFGFNFALGDINLTVGKASGNIHASAYGATVDVTALESGLTVDTTGYVAVLPYVNSILNMVESGALTANVSYETKLGDSTLTVSGSVVIALSPLNLSGEITVKYSSLEKTVAIVYDKDGYLYLTVDALKIKANSEDAIALISALLPADGETTEEEEKSVYDILDTVLGLDFNELLTLTEVTEGESKTLSAVLNGNYLLGLFGVDFDLGDVTLNVDSSSVKANALGVDITLVGGGTVTTLSEEAKADYLDCKPLLEKVPDLIPYIEKVAELISGKKLEARLRYEDDKLNVSGNVGIDFTNGLLVVGTLDVTLGEKTQTLQLAVQDEKVYLSLGGIKLYVAISDVSGLISSLTSEEDAGAEEQDLVAVLEPILSAVLNNDFVKLFTLDEGDDMLTLIGKGTELLKLFGIDFDLGEISLTVNKQSGNINVSAYGASACLTALSGELTFDPTGYTDLLSYAHTIIDMINTGSLTANVSYETTLGDTVLSVNGALVVELSPLQISGEVTVKYGSLEKKVTLYYGEDGFVYLVIDALKVKADSQDAIALIKSLVNTPEDEGESEEKDGLDVYAILEKIFAFDFDELLTVTENSDGDSAVLNVVVHGNYLLKLFGVDFDLGDVTLDIDSSSVKANALGVDISLVGGGTVTALTDSEKAAYVDLKPVLDALPDLLTYKALSLKGNVVLTAGNTEINLIVNEGVLSFADGLKAYLDVSLEMTELTLNLKVSIDTEGVKLALGALGIELKFDDLSHLGDAVLSLYEDIRKTVNPVSEKELLPQVQAIGELFDLLSSLFTTKKGTQTTALDLGDTLSGITLANSNKKNGLLAVSVMGITLDIVNTPYGFVGLEVAFNDSSLKVTGTINTETYEGEMAEMPAVDYLNRADLEELLDYLVAVVHTLSENNINISLSGVIGDDDTQTYPNGKYELEGEVRIYTGENTLIHLDLDKKGLWVDTEAYLYVNLALKPKSENDKGIYVQLFLLDRDENGNKDGILDVFLSLSMRKNGVAENPLTLYAPADELMPVVASLVAFLGVDVDILNDYLLKPWLSVETEAQLRGLGENILLTIKNIIGGSSEPATQSDGVKRAFDLNQLISAIKVGATEFELELDSETLFGTKGDPLKVKVGKEQGENGSRLTLLSVANVKNTSVSVGVSYEDKGRLAPSFKGMIPMKGIASLLKTLAYSTTHRAEPGEVISGEEKEHNYILNESFYIDGTISIVLSVGGSFANAKVKINVIACSVTIDEEGIVGVNIRFAYSATKVEALAGIVKLPVINGDTVVDLTGKDNMVYIKRVQSTDADGEKLGKDITLYRAMPLTNFGNDILAQMGFLFNFSDLVTNILNRVDMSGGDGGNTTPAEVDIGATVSNILKSIDYQNANGELWTIVLNGKALIDVLGDITVKIGADGEGKIRTLNAQTSLSVQGSLDMSLEADFIFHNPCGVMDQGVWDYSTDIAGVLIQAMDYKLATVDWSGTKFIEAELTTVEYRILGTLIDTQDIALATGTADTKGKVYGTIKYPDLTPYNENGLVAEWDYIYEPGDPLPDNRQITASYKALTKELTFVFRDGRSEKHDYTYGDTSFELPFERVDNLRVACYVDAYGNEYRTAEDLKNLDFDGDLTLTAVYERDVYVVTYLITEGNTREEELYYGETVTLFTPYREGYTFAGWFDGDNTYQVGDSVTVYGDMLLVAQWKAISEGPVSHLVTVRSEQPCEGFTGANGVYVKSYTYSGTPITLDTLSDLDDYWFMGYYTDKNGAGTKVTTVSDLDSDLTLYVYWRSKIVTFTINSDIEFAGSTVDKANNRYYKEYTLRDNYDLSPYLPAVDGYKSLELWHQVGDSYERVTSAKDLDGEQIWVLWIQNIKVTVNNFSESGARFTIKGHVEGGKVVAGKSLEIATAIKVTDAITGVYSIYSIDGKHSDTLKFGGEIKITNGEFGDSGMTSLNGLGWVAEYGGIEITIKFSYTRPDGNSDWTSTTDAAYVSKSTYTVIYDLKNGTQVPISDIRADYPYDNYDNATYVDVLARENNIIVPEKDGYTGYWDHVAVIGNMTVEPIYDAHRYNVRFESDHKIEGWELIEGKYVYELEMKHDSVVTFFNEGDVIASYTVVSDCRFTLPAITDMQKWGSVEITDGYARFVAQRNVDMLIYNSEVSFTYNGADYDSLPVEITEEYTLITPTAAGCTFLGWFRQVNGVWEKVEKISPTAGEDKATIVVQALWATDIIVDIVSKDKSVGGLQIVHTATGLASGGVLVGAFAGEAGVKGTLKLDYFINNNEAYSSTATKSAELDNYDGTAWSSTFSIETSWLSGRDYAHVVATVTWTYNGMTFKIGGNAKAHKAEKF